MIKIIVVGAVLFLVYLVFFKNSRKGNKKNDNYDQITDTLMECPTCGTFVSKDDAILSNGKYYCSKECLVH